jgi:hypothetical protein
MKCKYCGAPDSPVRQVPARVPFSDCYCDGCWERARDEYEMAEINSILASATTTAAIDELEERIKTVLVSELLEARFAEKVDAAFAEARGRMSRESGGESQRQ